LLVPRDSNVTDEPVNEDIDIALILRDIQSYLHVIVIHKAIRYTFSFGMELQPRLQISVQLFSN